jgi:hypothetical protein
MKLNSLSLSINSLKLIFKLHGYVRLLKDFALYLLSCKFRAEQFSFLARVQGNSKMQAVFETKIS